MSKFVEFTFCELPETPREFNIDKFRAKDPDQIKLYKDSKVPRRRKVLTYTEVTDEDKLPNFARVVPEGCVFVMGDNRNHSADSRSSKYGMIEEDMIVGKVVLPVLP